MLLYFDNYITNEPLHKYIDTRAKDVREGCMAYRLPDKLSIAMYTLASYAVIEWTNVIIKYELADPSKNEKFEKFVLELFPKAIIIRGRSDNQKKFMESVALMKRLGEKWVFYAGNADHPFISNETLTLKACLEKAMELKEKNRFVSVIYSHFGETRSWLNKDSYMYDKNYARIGGDENCDVVMHPRGNFDAIQLVHIDLFEHWFCSHDFGDERIIRSDLRVPEAVTSQDHVIIIPKKEMCSHFDGYSGNKYFPADDVNDILPPLFIPDGFFEGKIRIAFGYEEYREGWVNINPMKDKYSFRDNIGGTDLKLIVDSIPLFWKNRIAALDINPKADMLALERTYQKELERRANPWPIKSPYARLKRKMALGFKTYFLFYPYMLNFYKDNPEWLEARQKEGSGPKLWAKKVIYKAVICGYRLGVFKKKRE
jgi:hypothetical protein